MRTTDKKRIEKLFDSGRILYYSDIANELNIDLEKVVKICEELLREGKVIVENGS
jgi:DNA-binding Lrp family transcriptional regulator